MSSSSSNSNPLLSSNSSEDDEVQTLLQEFLDAANVVQTRIQQRRNNASGSRPHRRRTYIERGREQGHQQLFKDYFAEDATYPDHMFRRRFRMHKHVFLRIMERLENGMEYFQQRPDALGRPGISALTKCSSALRMLAYGNAADACDEYLRLSGGTARQCLGHFVEGIITFFGGEYLRRPTAADVQRLLSVGESRGFPGMLGSIDCMHWTWKNCPTAWKGQYSRGDHGHPTIILEAVASYDLWIWHAFFGVPGTCNDINVLDRSPVFDEVVQGRAPNVNFTVNGHGYNMGYYLTDGIYPDWAAFVKSIRLPQGPKAKLFAQKQECYCKDIERAFGVLQSSFAIIRNPALCWDIVMVGKIMMACIILHNMIVEDERDSYTHNGYEIPQFEEPGEGDASSSNPSLYSIERPDSMSAYIGKINEDIPKRVLLRSAGIHHQLKQDLTEHIWQRFGNN